MRTNFKEPQVKLYIYKKKKIKPILNIELDIPIANIPTYMENIFTQMNSNSQYLYIKPQVIILKKDIEKIFIN